MERPVRALIFDVDGTLAETEEVHRRAFNLAFDQAGLGWYWDRTLYEKLLAVCGGMARLVHYLDLVMAGLKPAERAAMVERLAGVHAEKARLYAQMIDQRMVRLRPGIERLFEEAWSHGLEIVLATTSSPENAEALILANLELDGLERVRAIVGGGAIGRRKPAPDVYLAALAAAGVAARNALVFEDSANGLKAATAAGIRTIVTPSSYSRGGDFSGAFAVLSHLGDFFEAYEHVAGAGDGETMVTVPALQRWVRDDDDLRSLLTLGGRPVY